VVFDLIVIGGGAAGFYGAIHAGELNPGMKILILEKTTKLLSKVRVSGGGRCNVTHDCFDPIRLSAHYPRGEKPLRSLFKKYNAKDTVQWFSEQGVRLKVEEDGRMFPVTDSSQTIINCFLENARKLKIEIKTGEEVTSIEKAGQLLEIRTQSGEKYYGTNVMVAIGGSAKPEAYSFLEKLGHTIKAPVPSLFTFNDTQKQFSDLMGIALPMAEVRIASTKFKESGPLLITHWGLSGPAVIRLSAWAAEYLHSIGYDFHVLVSWIGTVQEETIRNLLLSQKSARLKQKVHGHPLFDLPQRLWVRLCVLSDVPDDRLWGEMAHRQVNKLLERLIKCPFQIKGKTTFKEEFVTCGGVDLSEIDVETMESKKVKGVFFAGEVLNIDGETGGFNFQAAWSTAFLAARSLNIKKM
jgi:predicted Rossmann fold flavoprotein